jgi:uncharacterized protein (UPF0333 family)
MFECKLNKKGQGALEYLLIISGALVVAVIAIVLIINLSGSNKDSATDAQERFDYLIDNTIVPPIITDSDCNSSNQTILLYISPSPTSDVKGYAIKVDNNVDLGNVIPYNSGTLSVISPITLVDGNTYRLSAIALKNNTQSTPSTPAWTCIAHN